MSATRSPSTSDRGGAGTPTPGRVPAASPLSDPDTAHGQVGLAIKRAFAAARRLRGRETHRPGQVSYAQYGLLGALADGEPRSARELADLADLTAATVTQMLEGLEQSGLITRTRSELDRRIVLSVLTERGAGVVAERRARMEPRWRAALAEFDEAELRTAARVVNRVAEYFDAMLGESPAPGDGAAPPPTA